MPVAVAVALAAAVVGVVGSVYSSSVASDDMNKAQKEAKRLADIQRQDDLDYKKSQENLSKMGLKLQNKQFAWQRSESEKDRTERAGVRAYAQKEDSFNNILKLVNSHETLRGNLYATSQRGQQNLIGGKV